MALKTFFFLHSYTKLLQHNNKRYVYFECKLYKMLFLLNFSPAMGIGERNANCRLMLISHVYIILSIIFTPCVHMTRARISFSFDCFVFVIATNGALEAVCGNSIAF